MNDRKMEDIKNGEMSVAPKITEENKKWGWEIVDIYDSDNEPTIENKEPTKKNSVPNMPTKQRQKAMSWIKDFTPKQIEDELQFEMKDNGAMTYQELHDKFNIPFAYDEFKATPVDLKRLLLFVKLKKLRDPKLSNNVKPSEEEIDDFKREENKKKLSTATMPVPTQKEIDEFNMKKTEQKSKENYKNAVAEDKADRDLYKAKQPTREASQKVIDEIKAKQNEPKGWSLSDLFD